MAFGANCTYCSDLVCVVDESAGATGQARSVTEPNNPPSIPSDRAKQNLVNFVQPEYPPLAKAARIAGIVHASIVIDETGSVTSLKLISGPPHARRFCLQAIHKMEVQALPGGRKPATVQTEVEVSIPENITQSDIDQERKFQEATGRTSEMGVRP